MPDNRLLSQSWDRFAESLLRERRLLAFSNLLPFFGCSEAGDGAGTVILYAYHSNYLNSLGIK